MLSRAVPSASTVNGQVGQERNGLRLRLNNQTSQSQGNIDNTRSSTPATNMDPHLSFSSFVYHALLHLIAIAALYVGSDTTVHVTSTFFMVRMIYLSTRLSDSEARSPARLPRFGLGAPLASLVILWFLLHYAFVYTSNRGFSFFVKAYPVGLQFLVMALYFFTLRHKSLVICGNQPPGTGHHINNDFRLYFAGSGGHTGELLQMLTNSPPTDNIHRIWVVCHGDETSRKKIISWEDERKSGKSLVSGYEIATIRRAREVHQRWATVPVSIIRCAYDIYKVLTKGYPYRGTQDTSKETLGRNNGYPQVIVTNGPGTGLIIAGVAWLMKMFWRLPASSCKVLFIESIARVKTLSLTGKLFYYTGIATSMVVQHKAVGKKYGIRVEEMLTARELGNPNGDMFSGFPGLFLDDQRGFGGI